MFAESLMKFNSGKFDDVPMNESYSYENFIDDMYQLGRTLQETVNEYCRVVNEAAVQSIHEGTELVPVANDATKENLMDKLRNLWHTIVENTLKVLDNIYNFIYEQVVLHKNFIKKHEDAIMSNELIYEKDKGDSVINYTQKVGPIEIEREKKFKNSIRVQVDYIKSYKNILSPNFIAPYIDESQLKDYESDNGRLNKEKLNRKYKEEILGSIEKDSAIDIEDINKTKKLLIDNIDKVFNSVKSNKTKMRTLTIQKKNPPKNLTPEEVDRFKKNMINQIDSIREYNKVLLEYCKIDSSILRMFIKAEVDLKKEVK